VILPGVPWHEDQHGGRDDGDDQGDDCERAGQSLHRAASLAVLHAALRRQAARCSKYRLALGWRTIGTGFSDAYLNTGELGPCHIEEVPYNGRKDAYDPSAEALHAAAESA